MVFLLGLSIFAKKKPRRWDAAAHGGLMRILWMVALLLLGAGQAQAHAGDQGFVLLLPTDFYIWSGVASVALTVILLAMLPDRAGAALFRPLHLWRLQCRGARNWISGAVAVALVVLVGVGLYGSRDPLVNPLPLVIWTLWWVMLVTLQGLVMDHWRWINPFTGPAAFLSYLTGERAPLRYPRALGYGPGMVGFVAFAGFLLADIAPSDPARLAVVIGLYWLINLAGLCLFGPRWLLRVECVTILMRIFTRMAVLGRNRGRLALGLPGWQLLARRPLPMGGAIFALLMLAVGSFDGLNETFLWLGILGLNPLEFPGRSAVVGPTLVGLGLSVVALVLIFAASTWLGLFMAGARGRLALAVRLFAPAILPIALGYHIAHYLTSFLVEGQYALAALSDPLNSGADLLGLGQYSVTTGFMFQPGPVKAIWLTQAGAVVLGHVIAIVLAHVLALRLVQGGRGAMLSQLPLAVFMVAYTFFGLWLLAAPRGF